MGRRLSVCTLAVLLLCLVALECGVLAACPKPKVVTREAVPTGCFGGKVTECQQDLIIRGATVVCSNGATQKSVETDINGRYYFHSLTLGDWTCTASSAGYTKGTGRILVREDENEDLDLELCYATGNISVCVTNCYTSEAYHLATFTCQSPGPKNTKLYFSESLDKCGCATLTGLTVGKAECYFSHLETKWAGPFRVNERITISTNFTVCPAVFPVKAHVVDSSCNARGVPRATVKCHSALPQGSAVTDSKGWTHLGLTEGDHNCCVEAEGYGKACNLAIKVLPKKANNNELTVNLNPLSGNVTGRVHLQFRPQAGVSGAQVTCYLNQRNLDGTANMNPGVCEPLTVSTKADANGNFVISGRLGHGPFVCVAKAAGYETSSCGGRFVGGQTQNVNISVKPNPKS